MTLYRCPVVKVAERQYTWSIHDGSRLVANEVDPSTGEPRIYELKRACRSAAHVRYRELYDVDNAVLDAVHCLWGYGAEMASLIEVLTALAEDDSDRAGAS